MKHLKSFMLPGVFLLAIVAYRFYNKSRPIEIPKYGNYLSCVGTPHDLDIKLTGEVYLLKKALPEDQNKHADLYGEAAFYQNLYAFTNMIEHKPNPSLKWVSFGTKAPKIKILDVQEIGYPHSITFENEHSLKGFPEVAHEYLSKLMPLGKINKGEAAVKVKYELESELLTCVTEGSPQVLGDLKVYQPIDPYLAYFYVPKSHRVKINNQYRKNAEGTINPCINPGGVNSSGFNGFGLWYFWRPDAQGHSSDMTPFDCTLFYRPGDNVNLVQVELRDAETEDTQYFDFARFKNLNRPIKFSVLIGGIEGKEFPVMDKEKVKHIVDLYVSDISLSEARKQLPSSYDLHLSKLLILLFQAKNHMQIHSYEVDPGELQLSVVLRGKLKLSKKDVEYKLFLSPNDPSFEGSEYFAENFANDFMTHDILSYEGHASTGSVFSAGLNLLKERDYSTQDRSISYQIFALHSCSSTFYYRPEHFPKIDHPEFRRDIVRAAGAYSDGNGNGTLGLLAALDQYLYNESYIPFAFWAKTFKSDNFYILTNHK